MEPRGYFGTLSMIFGVTALPFALIWSILFFFMTGINFSVVLYMGIFTGIFFGLTFGAVMAIFLQVRTISITIKDKKSFLENINIYLAQIGYIPESQTEYIMTFKPSFQAGLLAGKISTQVREKDATIIGPSMYVNKLHKKILTTLT